METMTLSPHTFLYILTIAAALLALWVLARFPARGPKSVPMAIANLVAAYFVGLAAVNPLMNTLGDIPIPGAVALAIVGGGLPPLLYLLTSTAWLLRSVQSLLPHQR